MNELEAAFVADLEDHYRGDVRAEEHSNYISLYQRRDLLPLGWEPEYINSTYDYLFSIQIEGLILRCLVVPVMRNKKRSLAFLNELLSVVDRQFNLQEPKSIENFYALLDKSRSLASDESSCRPAKTSDERSSRKG